MLAIIGLLLVVASLYFAWKSRTPDGGYDVRKGIAALAMLIAAFLALASDWLTRAVQ